MLAHEDKNGDGLIQYSADPDTNEMVKVDNDIMVLANPEIAKLPNWVIALVAAGGLAAALSTAAGLLLAISSAISHDLMKGVFTPDISEKNELLAGRIAMAGAIGLAGYFGLHPPDFAAGTVAIAFGLAASSIFPALMMGIFNKKVNRTGAVSGMIAGIGITMLYVFQHKGIMFIPGTAFLGDTPANWFLGIEPNAFGVVGAIVYFVGQRIPFVTDTIGPVTFAFLVGMIPVGGYFVSLVRKASPEEKPGLAALIPVYVAGGAFFMVLHLSGGLMTVFAENNTDRRAEWIPSATEFYAQKAMPSYYGNAGPDLPRPDRLELDTLIRLSRQHRRLQDKKGGAA